MEMKRTIVIVDLAHNGTTMTAGILHLLGVPMVQDKNDMLKMEDNEIHNAIWNEEEFKKIIAERDAQYDTWGFKRCGMWRQSYLLKHLRNPLYLAIYKDPVSVTRRRYGGELSRFRVRGTLNQMTESIQGIYDAKIDVNLLSYQDAIVDPREFVTDLMRIAEIEPKYGAIEQAVKYIEPGVGYKTIEYT